MQLNLDLNKIDQENNQKDKASARDGKSFNQTCLDPD